MKSALSRGDKTGAGCSKLMCGLIKRGELIWLFTVNFLDLMYWERIFHLYNLAGASASSLLQTASSTKPHLISKKCESPLSC